MAAETSDIYGRLREVENRALTSLNRMDAHETICAERYAGIISTHNEIKGDIGRVTNRLLAIGLALLGGMATILIKLIFFS